MAQSRGIDISHHQGAMDWRRLRADHGLSWGACKATEGTNFRDAQFSRNWTNLHAAGLARMAYHFARPERSTAAKQAAFFLSVVRPVKGDILCLDLEASGLSQAGTNRWAAAFGDYLRLHAPGITTVLYTGGYAHNESGRNLSQHFDWWWFPRYATMKPVTRWPADGSAPTVGVNTTGWARPHIWQWAASLRTYANPVDANVSPLTAAQLAAGPNRPAAPPANPVLPKPIQPAPSGITGRDTMPTEHRTSWRDQAGRALKPNAWTTLLMDTLPDGAKAVGTPSIIEGPGVLTGELSAYVKGTTAGEAIQFKPVIMRYDGKNWVLARSLGNVEAIATSGTTYCRIPVTTALAVGQRLRLQAAGNGKVTATGSTLLVWKG